MSVPKYLAQNIVEDMKDIINQDINFFDSKGVIIASTDKTRIGDFHGGAKRVLDLRQDLIISFDEQYKGAKKGINVPVYFENEIIGVIGITGEKEEVEKYGKIIQRMTEILVKEGYIQEQEKIEREGRRQFIEELLFRYHSDDRALFTRAELLNIKTNKKRIVAVARIMIEDDDFVLTPNANEDIFNSFRSQVEYNPQNLIAQSGMNIIIIYELRIKENIETLVSSLKEHIENKHNINVYFGIGEPCDDIKRVKRSYKEAKKALDISLALKNKEVLYYKDLDIGLLIDDIPIDTINKYVQKIFANMDKDEINEYSKMMDSYIDHNGSITKASDELFIHKNTLQYRLNKLRELTGFDPRNLRDMVVLYLAFTLHRLDFDK